MQTPQQGGSSHRFQWRLRGSVLTLEPLPGPVELRTSAWHGLVGTAAGPLLSSQMVSHLQLSSFLPRPLHAPHPPPSSSAPLSPPPPSSPPLFIPTGLGCSRLAKCMLESGDAWQANQAWQERAAPRRGTRQASQAGSRRADPSPH